jgi:hypothetical protein
MRTESARGNVRGNKRPDLELHPRTKPADRGGGGDRVRRQHHTSNLGVVGSNPTERANQVADLAEK